MKTKTQQATMALILAASAGIGGMAFALGTGTQVGLEDTAIIAALEADGYTIREIEREDGEIEVEALKDGIAWEIEIDPKTGAILDIEQDD